MLVWYVKGSSSPIDNSVYLHLKCLEVIGCVTSLFPKGLEMFREDWSTVQRTTLDHLKQVFNRHTSYAEVMGERGEEGGVL